MPCVTCHLSGVMCQVSRVTCHLSLTPTATATDPPANSPIMHSRLVCEDPNILIRQKIFEMAKPKTFKGYANISDTLFDQKSPVHREAGFLRWHTHTDRHKTHGHCNLEAELAHRGPIQVKYDFCSPLKTFDI